MREEVGTPPPRDPRRRGGQRRPPAAARRRAALSRRDLEALLAQLEGTKSRRRNDGEINRLRRLLAEAIAADDEAADDDWAEDDWDVDDVDGDGWDDVAPDPFVTDDLFDTDEPWAAPRRRGGWEHYPSTKPIPVEGGLAAKTRRGAIGSTWWSQRFLAAVESVLVGGRLARGRTYARKGQVVELEVGPGLIEARVQGSRKTPYRVRLAMPAVPDEGWDRIVAALGAKAAYAARMLAGELPHEVEEVFAAEGASLFPAPGARLTTDCTCPDWANPCKHIAAVCYLVAEAFDVDPFGVLAWRGRDRDAVLSELRTLRAGTAEAGPLASDGPAAPAVDVPPLAQCTLGFFKAGPELAEVRIRPQAAELPGAVLRHLPTGLLEVRGRDVGELLAPAYAELTAAAARRAIAEDGPTLQSR